MKGIQRNGDRIFATSQIKCPVRTGYLKNTGVKEDLSKGTRISYRANYSSRVHNGSEEKAIDGTQTVYISQHKRKVTGVANEISSTERLGGSSLGTHKGEQLNPYKFVGRKRTTKYITVRAHKRQYKDRRLVPIDARKGIYRVISKWPKLRARPFLLEATKQEIVHLTEDISFYLKRIKGVQK